MSPEASSHQDPRQRGHAYALVKQLVGAGALVADFTADARVPGHQGTQLLKSAGLRVWAPYGNSLEAPPAMREARGGPSPRLDEPGAAVRAGTCDLVIWLDAPTTTLKRSPGLEAAARALKPNGLLLLGWNEPLPRRWKPERTMAALFPSTLVLSQQRVEAVVMVERGRPRPPTLQWLTADAASRTPEASKHDGGAHGALVLLGKGALPEIAGSVFAWPVDAAARREGSAAEIEDRQHLEALQQQILALQQQQDADLRRVRDEQDARWSRRIHDRDQLLRGATSQLEAAQSQQARLEQDLIEAKQALVAAEGERARAEADFAGQLAERQAQLDVERRARVELREDCEQRLSLGLTAASERVATAQALLERQTQVAVELQADVQSLRQQLHQATEAVARSEERSAHAARETERVSTMADRLRAKSDALHQEIVLAREATAVAEAGRSMLATELEEARQSLAEARRAQEALQRRAQFLAETLADAEEGLVDLEERHAAAVASSNEELRRARLLLDTRETELSQLQAELALQRSEWHHSQAALQAAATREESLHRQRQQELQVEGRRRQQVAQSVENLARAVELALERVRLTMPALPDPLAVQIRELLAQLRHDVGSETTLLLQNGEHDRERGVQLEDLLSLADEAFVQTAYRLVLGRDVDPDGRRHYMERLGQGELRLRVLADLRWSAEGRARGQPVPRLDDALRLLRRSRLPLWGRRARAQLESLLAGRQQRLVPTQALTTAEPLGLREVRQRIEDLAHGSALLAEAVPVAVALGRADPGGSIDAWTSARQLVECSVPDFVGLAYRLLLGRDPDATERALDEGRIAQGASRVYVLEQLGRRVHAATAPVALRLPDSDLASAPNAQALSPRPHLSIVLLAGSAPPARVRLAIRRLQQRAPSTPSEIVVVSARRSTTGTSPGPLAVRWVSVDLDAPDAVACDAALAVAQGELVVFAPGDVDAVPLAWDELVRTFDIHAGTAAVSARLWRAPESQGGDAAVCTLAAPLGWSGLALKVGVARSLGGLVQFESMTALGQALNSRGYRTLSQPAAGLQSAEAAIAAPARAEAEQPVVLVVEPHQLRPDRDAGSLCVLNLMIAWRERGWKVRFACLRTGGDQERQLALMRRCGIETVALGDAALDRHLARQGGDYAAVMLCRPDTAHAFSALVRRHAARARLLYFAHDLHHLRLHREAALAAARTTAADHMRDRELTACRLADVTLLLSDAEQQELTRLAPDVVAHVVPMAHDFTRSVIPSDQRTGAVFVGHFGHRPNVDAVAWLIDEIVPALRRRGCDIELLLVGDEAPVPLQQRAPEGVRFVGAVDDLTEPLRACRMAIAPLRFGAGVKGKVIRSVAAGVPVVATTMALEGLALQDDSQVLVADDVDAFASAMARLDSDPGLRDRLAEAAFETLRAKHGPEATVQALGTLLQALQLPDRPTGFPARFLREAVFYLPTL